MSDAPLIVPAVLEKNYADVVARVASVAGLAGRVQVDLCDGIYVPATTWPFGDASVSVARMRLRGETLPYFGDIEYEFDLMVEDPLPLAETAIALGASRIVLHAKAPKRAEDILRELLARHGGAPSLAVGIALTNDSFVPAWERAAALASFVQVMGIARIGRQGEPTDPRTVATIRSVRAAYPHLPLQVDGSVGPEDVRAFLRAGAETLVVGSAVFSAHTGPKEAYERLLATAESAALL